MVSVVVGVVELAVVRSPQWGDGLDGVVGFDAWVRGMHHLSYEHELIRRGLVGEVMRLTGVVDRPIPTFAVFAAVYLTCAVLLGCLIWQALAWLDDGSRAVATGLLLALPFAAPDLAFELGRYDTLLYVGVLLFVLGRRAPWWAYLLAGLIGPLIHEVFVVACVPLLVLSLLPDRRRLVALLGGCLVSGAVLLAWGDMSSRSEDQLVAEMDADVPGYAGLAQDDILLPHKVLFDSPGENLRAVVDSYSPATAAHVAAGLVPLAVLLALYRWVRGPVNRAIVGRIAFVSLPLLVLFTVGIDVVRWVALASLNGLLVMLVDLRDRPPDVVRSVQPRTAAVVLTATAIAGPVGTVAAYPLWQELIGRF